MSETALITQQYGLTNVTQAISREHPAGMGGTQVLVRFSNDYGASVVRFYGSYGADKGLWELAVLHYHGPGIDDYNLTYETPVTDDVIGYLDPDELRQILQEIAQLPCSTTIDVSDG